MRTDLPIIGALTPDAPVAEPDGATRLDSPIRAGLPHVLPLLPRWRVILSVPTGSARAWLDSDPAAPLPDGAAPRLRFQLDGTTRFIAPLVRGDGYEVVDDGRAVLRAVILDWSLHVGDMRGPGDFGSYLRLAVVAADRGVAAFGPVPASDFVISTLPPEDRKESNSALFIPLRYQRLKMERIRRKVEIIR